MIARRANQLRFIGIDVKAFSQKYPTSVFQKYVVLSALSRFRSEGRFAIVTNVGSGMRWTRRCARRAHSRGRPSRVVLAPRRWRQACQDDQQATVANKPG